LAKCPLILGGHLLGVVTLPSQRLIKVQSKETTVVVAALSRHIRKLPASLRRSLTWNRGHEMAHYKIFSVASDVNRLLCSPQPLAARHQRKHQPAAASIPAKENRVVTLHSGGTGQDSAATQSTSEKTLGFLLPQANCRIVLRRPVELARIYRQMALLCSETARQSQCNYNRFADRHLAIGRQQIWKTAKLLKSVPRPTQSLLTSENCGGIYRGSHQFNQLT
jgi:hypothetical protein